MNTLAISLYQVTCLLVQFGK